MFSGLDLTPYRALGGQYSFLPSHKLSEENNAEKNIIRFPIHFPPGVTLCNGKCTGNGVLTSG